eukprot:5878662-Prymnesium_polylepis.1
MGAAGMCVCACAVLVCGAGRAHLCGACCAARTLRRATSPTHPRLGIFFPESAATRPEWNGTAVPVLVRADPPWSDTPRTSVQRALCPSICIIAPPCSLYLGLAVRSAA